MLKNKKGFTLTEVIISIALIGIIAVGLLPAFSSQYKMTINARKITTAGFEAQGELEKEISQTKKILKETGKNTEKRKEFTPFGRTVEMSKVELGTETKPEIEYLSTNSNKIYTVYLSKELAERESGNPLVAKLVRIDEEKRDAKGNVTISEGIESVSVRLSSTLVRIKGAYEIEKDGPKQDLNIYRWYVSKEGISNPRYPEDFEYNSAWRDKNTISKEELKTHAVNRYVKLILIPVDKSGLRGEEVASQSVYVQGEEWRADTFAWVDKNLDGILDSLDIQLNKIQYLLRNFNTEILIPTDDDTGATLDASGGSLYVPMRLQEETLLDTITLSNGGDIIDWKVAKSIHFANNIVVNNNTDIRMETTEGNIRLYRFIKINSEGNAEFDGEKVKLINDGAKLIGPNIYLTAGDKNGNIFLDPNTKLRATDLNEGLGTIQLLAAERISMEKASLEGGIVSLESKLKEDKTDNIILKDTKITGANLKFNTSGTISGGSWDNATTVQVADGKTLKLSNIVDEEGNTNIVDNRGSFDLGNTGGLEFEGDISSAVKKAPRLSLEKAGINVARISTDYGRNVAYADANGPEKINSPGNLQMLGTGQTNLEYTVTHTSGYGEVQLEYTFDGNGNISIRTENAEPATEAYTNYYNLYVADRYAQGISSSIIFRVSAVEGGNPEVEVIGPEIPNVTVTFDANGGKFEDGTTSKGILLQDGQTLTELPPDPDYNGFNFTVWNTKEDGMGRDMGLGDRIYGDIILYAQWTKIPMHTVTFYANYPNNQNTVVGTILVEHNKTIGEFGNLPTAKRQGYTFTKWTETQQSDGATVTASRRIVEDLNVYAQWTARRPFSEITTGQYVRINGANYQKIDASRLLLRGTVKNGNSETMTWSVANDIARNYYNTLNIEWVINSGLADYDTLYAMSSSNIRNIGKTWFGYERDRTTTWYVRANGEINYWSKTGNQSDDRCRPYITVNTTNLYIESGSGTSANPYTLIKE